MLGYAYLDHFELDKLLAQPHLSCAETIPLIESSSNYEPAELNINHARRVYPSRHIPTSRRIQRDIYINRASNVLQVLFETPPVHNQAKYHVGNTTLRYVRMRLLPRDFEKGGNLPAPAVRAPG